MEATQGQPAWWLQAHPWPLGLSLAWDRMDATFRHAGMEVDHQDWLRLKAEDQLVGRVQYRKVLTALAEKYYGRTRDFQAIADRLLQAWGETESVEALPHDSTITDTLTDTNGTSLDAHVPTPSNWGSWVEIAGANWEIQNNKAAATRVNTPTYARAGYNFASDEHYAQADYTFYAFHADDRIGLLVRVSTDASPNHDGYLVWSRLSTSITHPLYKVVDGFQSWLKDVNEKPSPTDTTH